MALLLRSDDHAAAEASDEQPRRTPSIRGANAEQFLPLDREPVPSHDHRGREGSKMITQSVKASDD
jgi:hypothetical protein